MSKMCTTSGCKAGAASLPPTHHRGQAGDPTSIEYCPDGPNSNLQEQIDHLLGGPRRLVGQESKQRRDHGPSWPSTFLPASGAPMSSSCAPGVAPPTLFGPPDSARSSWATRQWDRCRTTLAPVPGGPVRLELSTVGLGAGLSFVCLYAWLTKGGLCTEVAFASRGRSAAVSTRSYLRCVGVQGCIRPSGPSRLLARLPLSWVCDGTQPIPRGAFQTYSTTLARPHGLMRKRRWLMRPDLSLVGYRIA